MKRLVLCALVFAGCDSELDPMMQQQYFQAYEGNNFYDDGRAMRIPVAGTVPRERVLDPQLYEAPPVTMALLQAGRNRFDVTCGACHGLLGDGDSVVAHKMAVKPPPSLHSERLRAMPSRDLFRIITEGYGMMPAYGSDISVSERWAVVHYVRALQLSQNASLDQAPPEKRRQLEGHTP